MRPPRWKPRHHSHLQTNQPRKLTSLPKKVHAKPSFHLLEALTVAIEISSSSILAPRFQRHSSKRSDFWNAETSNIVRMSTYAALLTLTLHSEQQSSSVRGRLGDSMNMSISLANIIGQTHETPLRSR